MKKLLPSPLFLTVFFVLLLFSCTKNDSEITTQNTVVNQLKNDLKLEQFTNKNIAENLVVNWDTSIKIEKDGLEIYEIEVSEKNPSEIESNLFQNQLKYELIAIKKGTEIHAYLVEAYSSLNHILFTNSIQNLSTFTGTLNVYQLEGNSIGQLVVFNGHSKNTTEKSVIEPLNEVINLYTNKQSLTNKAPQCVEIFIVFSTALIREYHFSKITVGTETTTKYNYTTLKTVKSQSFMNTPYPCGTNGDSRYILQRTTVNRDVIDEIVEDVISSPCETASITTALSKDGIYISAKALIQTAAADGFEHSITLGKDANGAINQAPMNSGNQQYQVSTNYTWPRATAALHNHPNNTPLSAGDIYASVRLNEKSSNFTTSFVLTNGETYGIVVTSLALAQAFVKTYPADQLPGYNPEFPDVIFDQMLNLVDNLGSSIEGRTTAMAFVLDKYNAGITLLKQDGSGDFKPIKTQETTQLNGSKTYTSIPCN